MPTHVFDDKYTYRQSSGDANDTRVRATQYVKWRMTPGAHNLIFMGPLGAGQTLLARAPPSILPRLNLRHPLSVTDIRAVTFTVHG